MPRKRKTGPVPDLSKMRTYPIAERKNLVSLTDLVRPEDSSRLLHLAGGPASS
jgi:hypothetical protein